jgi:hypothetical protein
MKSIAPSHILLILCILWLTVLWNACVAPIPFFVKDYQVATTVKTSVGNPMIRWAVGTRVPSTQFVDTVLVFHSYDPIKNPEGTLKELIYRGTSEDKLFCVYREFAMADFSRTGSYSAIAKPAFFLELTYDMKQSRIINIQDFSIRIERAGQEQVEFTLLSEPSYMNDRPARLQIRR